MTDLEYINDPDLHGNYQYVSLEEVVESMVQDSLDEDSYLKNTPRFKIIKAALEGIRKLVDTANDVKGFEITVPDNLQVVVPMDFVNWVRVSLVVFDPITRGFMMHPLNENRNINTAIGYLQDHKGDLLFDHEGNILTADSSSGYGHGYKRYKVSDMGPCGQGRYLEPRDVSVYGEFVLDERKGVFLFSSDLMDKEVVIEYVSDGLQEKLKGKGVTVHKGIVKPLEDWIYYTCIRRRRNVPANEKDRALKDFQTSLHKANISRLNLKLYEIARHF